MKKIVDSLKTIDYKMFGVLLLVGFVPTVYTTVRIFFLGQLPGDSGYSIASQLSWVNLIYEIVQEALILPLFYFIGRSFSDNKDSLTNTIRSSALVAFGIYTFLSLVIIIFAEPLIRWMAQDVSLIKETATYIRLETIANIFATLVKFMIVVFVTIKKDVYMLLMLFIQMILSVLLDTFLVSELSVSAKLGVNGIAYTNIIVNTVLLLLAITLLYREGIKLFGKERLSFTWMKEWVRVSGFSGLESFVRNIAFMLMIVRMVNVVGEQGTFWIANNFIWGWLLLPIIQLGELIKSDFGTNGMKANKERAFGYFAITTVIVLLWCISIPLYEPFIRNVMNVENSDVVTHLVLISLVFYVLFAYNNVIDSIFYGLGKTNYMLFQSLVINIVYYGLMFVLYVTKIYVPTLDKIALMFAGGTALDSVLTYFIYIWMVKKNKNVNEVGVR